MDLLILWDSSTLAKRYLPETGTEIVAALLSSKSAMCLTFSIYLF